MKQFSVLAPTTSSETLEQIPAGSTIGIGKFLTSEGRDSLINAPGYWVHGCQQDSKAVASEGVLEDSSKLGVSVRNMCETCVGIESHDHLIAQIPRARRCPGSGEGIEPR